MRYNRRKTAPRRKTTKPRRKTAFRKTYRKPVSANYAKAIEIAQGIAGSDESGITLNLNTPYYFATTISAGHPRCTALCEQYEKYKITNAMWKFLPRATDFAAGSPPPYIHIHKMKSPMYPTYFDANWLQGLGTRPILFNRPITVNLRPQIADGVIGDVSGNQHNITNAVGVKSYTSPWLATHDLFGSPVNPQVTSSTEHYGLLVYITQQGNSSNAPIAEYESGITALFNKPYNKWLTAPEGAATTVSMSM